MYAHNAPYDMLIEFHLKAVLSTIRLGAPNFMTLRRIAAAEHAKAIAVVVRISCCRNQIDKCDVRQSLTPLAVLKDGS